MPNAGDDLPEPWRPMLAAIVATFQEQDLVPAHGGGHVAGRAAVRGPAEIRDFLGDEGLANFGALPDRRWAVGGMRASRAEAFLATLEMKEWGFSEFLEAFQRAFAWSWNRSESAAGVKARSWFDALPDQQIQRFYMLVDTAMTAQRHEPYFAHLSFVRVEDGTRAKPGEAFLSPADASEGQEAAAHGLALVRSALTRTGRARGKSVEQFLLKTGVRVISERDYLAAIIRASYAEGAAPPTSERHLQHMRRFLRWHADSGDHDLFEDVAFLRVEGADAHRRPDNVYLGAPFAQNALSRIYGGKVKGRDRLPLWSGYAKLKREELLSLMKAVGVEVTLARLFLRTRSPALSAQTIGGRSRLVSMRSRQTGKRSFGFPVFSEARLLPVLSEAYWLKTPASPHLAAEIDGITIDPEALVLPNMDGSLAVEGAGGLLERVADWLKRCYQEQGSFVFYRDDKPLDIQPRPRHREL